MMANVAVRVELIIDLPQDRKLTTADVEMALIEAVQTRRWFHVSNPEQIIVRPDLEG